MMLRSVLIALMLTTGGLLTQVNDADAAVRVRSTPKRTVVRYNGPDRRLRKYFRKHFGYRHVAPVYGYRYPAYGSHYGYYGPGRRVIATPYHVVYGPQARYRSWW